MLNLTLIKIHLKWIIEEQLIIHRKEFCLNISMKPKIQLKKIIHIYINT